MRFSSSVCVTAPALRGGALAILLALNACGGSSEEPAPEASEGSEVAAAPPPEPIAPPAPAPEAPPPAPAAEAPPAEPAAAPPAPAMPPFAAVVIHTVKDFDAWLPVFEADAEARKGATVMGEAVMRGTDNDKNVVLYLPAADIEKVKAFSSSPELKAKMKEAGVKGKPTIYMFKSVGGKMSPPSSGDRFGAIAKYTVKDFDAFKTALEGAEQARTDAGMSGWGIGQGVDKATEAYVYFQSNDLEKLKAYLASKDTKAAMKTAGAKGQPTVTVVKEVSQKMY